MLDGITCKLFGIINNYETMKRLFAVLLLGVSLAVQTVSAQRVEYVYRYTPLNQVPDSIREMVTPEEYELWKTMSSVYKIDYTYLKDMSPEGKELLYESVRKACEQIRNGEFTRKPGVNYLITMETRIDTTLTWRTCEWIAVDENIHYCQKRATVYVAEQSDKVGVACAVWYVYDAAKNDLHVIKTEAAPIGERVELSGPKSFSYTYNPERKCLTGAYAGSLRFHAGGEWRDEAMQKRFTVPI